jgi:hypothetical protein
MLNPGEIGGIAGGAAVLVAGLGIMRIGRRSRRLNRALADPDSATRLAAIDLLTERGLSGHLNVLVERALVEDDPQVRESLVGVLRHAEWEPGSDRRLLQLRTWAGRCAAESVVESSTATDQGSVSVDIGQEANSPMKEDEAPTNVDQQEDHPVNTTMDRWFSELLAGDDLDAPEPEIDFLPTVSIPRSEDANGGRAPGVSSGSKDAIPIAKAEQNAIRILREAGYRVATTSEPSPAGTVDVDSLDGIGGSLEASDLELLKELCVRRTITATILEEATRRMRAENSRLEALLARFNESR